MRLRSTLAVLALALAPVGALAFTISSIISDPCHEQITADAANLWRCDGSPTGCAAPPPATWLRHAPDREPDEVTRRLMATSTFAALEQEAPWTAALARYSLSTGNRFNDLHGRGGAQLSELRLIHGQEAGQDEHCLRNVEHDGMAGNRAALQACRDFIETQLQLARESFVAPAAERYRKVVVYEEHYGHLEVETWGGFFHLGRALHAVQDSYAHTLRSEDLSRIHAVANYAEHGADGYDEARDGPGHSKLTDTCGDAPGGPLAVEATLRSAQLLEGFGSWLDGGDRQQLDAVLDRILAYEDGCDSSNGYCQTPWVEVAHPPPSSCSAGGAGALAWPFGLLTLLRLGARRRALRQPR